MSQPDTSRSCPMPLDALLDRTFLEHRAKLLDLAAFLDRCERCPPPPDQDHRLTALRGAMDILIDDQPQRARRILEQLSDPSIKPLDTAPGKSATGAPGISAPGTSAPGINAPE